jgi:hypothetical protein
MLSRFLCLQQHFCFGHSLSKLNWEFSYWISVCGKLLVCVMFCIMVYSFCFLSGVSGSECILVM